ncbi:thiamine diphosphokinase [Ilumatobacter sp.]|uniref:thiamine diphosphokinase n=1 Tax=Ilumatobacter sp. TaxID=1967498 RepID=UPI003B51A309
MNAQIVIVTGSEPLDDEVIAALDPDAVVLAADGGMDLALAAGLRPSALIGDCDSVSDEGVAWAKENATVARHPTDKDRTDTELALAVAVDMRPERLTMVGGGDRLDHTLAALGALAARHLTGIPEIDAWWSGQHVDVLHGPGRRTLRLAPGSTLSLITLGRPCDKVSITGVRWPLEAHRLQPGAGIAVSNEVTDPDGDVAVSLSSGVVHVFDVPSDAPRDQRSGGRRRRSR